MGGCCPGNSEGCVLSNDVAIGITSEKLFFEIDCVQVFYTEIRTLQSMLAEHVIFKHPPDMLITKMLIHLNKCISIFAAIQLIHSSWTQDKNNDTDTHSLQCSQIKIYTYILIANTLIMNKETSPNALKICTLICLHMYISHT